MFLEKINVFSNSFYKTYNAIIPVNERWLGAIKRQKVGRGTKGEENVIKICTKGANRERPWETHRVKRVQVGGDKGTKWGRRSTSL